MRAKGFENSNFVAALELRTAQAVLPYLERQFASFDLVKSKLNKKVRHVGEREYRLETVLNCFRFQRFYDPSSQPCCCIAGFTAKERTSPEVGV